MKPIRQTIVNDQVVEAGEGYRLLHPERDVVQPGDEFMDFVGWGRSVQWIATSCPGVIGKTPMPTMVYRRKLDNGKETEPS